jgi:hypothetical protein
VLAYTWSAGSLSPGEGGLITITGQLVNCLPAGLVITNTATITSTQVDNYLLNNESSAPISVLNGHPEVIDDDYDVYKNNVLVMAAPGVMENDSDPNCDTLTATLLAGPISGTLVFNIDGSFIYTPTEDYLGEQGFSYRVCDDSSPSLCSDASVVLTVRKPPPPVGGLVISLADPENEAPFIGWLPVVLLALAMGLVLISSVMFRSFYDRERESR